MKTKQKYRSTYVILGIFSTVLIYVFFRFIYTDSFIQAGFRSFALKDQQKIIRAVGTYISPFVARSFMYWLKLPKSAMHDIVPVLGESAYHSLGQKGFAVCDGEWTASCYMGVMIGAIQRFGYTPAVIDEATNYCQKYSLWKERKSLCAQAAGYAILWLNSYWYIESLQFCDQVFDDITLQNNCWVGVSHENVNRAGDSLHGLYEVPWTADNMHYPCDSIPLAYQPACISEQVKVIRAREFGGDTQKTIDYCKYFMYQEAHKACMSALDVQN